MNLLCGGRGAGLEGAPLGVNCVAPPVPARLLLSVVTPTRVGGAARRWREGGGREGGG